LFELFLNIAVSNIQINFKCLFCHMVRIKMNAVQLYGQRR
jgi:hypothetical protein